MHFWTLPPPLLLNKKTRKQEVMYYVTRKQEKSRICHALGLNGLANFRDFHMPGTLPVRRLMGHAATGARVVCPPEVGYVMGGSTIKIQDSRFKIHSKIHPYSFEGVLQIVNLRLQLKYMELKIVHTYK